MNDPYGRDPRLKVFKNFLYLVWMTILHVPPTPIQYEIADWLQYGPDRLQVLAARGFGKSWIADAFAVWTEYWNPETANVLAVSASKAHADDISVFAIQIISEVPECNFLIPTGDSRFSKVAFDVGPASASKQPSMKSLGITSQLTGSRADLILSDDIETAQNSLTQETRDKLRNASREYEAIRKPRGRIAVLGTPQTNDTIYLGENSMEEAGYAVRFWPARYPDKELAEFFGDRLAPSIREALKRDPSLAGKPTEPTRFGEQDLFEREIGMGRSEFARQYMLDTRATDAHRFPLKLRDLVIASYTADVGPERVIWTNHPDSRLKELPHYGMGNDGFYAPAADSDSKWVPYGATIMFVDPAGTGQDETAYAIVRFLNGFLHVAECTGLPGGYSDATMVTLSERAKAHKVSLALVEDNFGNGMFAQLLLPHLKRIHPSCGIEGIHSVGQKEKRIIDTLEPLMNQHRLCFARSVVEGDAWRDNALPPDQALRYHLFYQMVHLTTDRGALAHDDRIDALAGACAYFAEAVSRDTEKAVQAGRRQRLDAELREWDRNSYTIGAPKPVQRTWIGHNRAVRERPAKPWAYKRSTLFRSGL